MTQNDNDPFSSRDGEAVRRIVVGVLTALLVSGVLGVFGLWAVVVQVRADLNSFIEPGSRFTAAQGSEIARRVGECERRVERIQGAFAAHKAWGEQWSREAERRMESLERVNGMNGYWQHRDGNR